MNYSEIVNKNKAVAWIAVLVVNSMVLIMALQFADQLMDVPVPQPAPRVIIPKEIAHRKEAPQAPAAKQEQVVKPVVGTRAGLTYDQAIKQYGSQRLQFDAGCQVIPARISVNNGAMLMLDNRSAGPRSVAVGGVRYELVGYGFKVIPVRVAKAPKTLMVDCGTGRNNGQIVVNY